MTKFAQPVSMECTEEQYNRDLKDGLEKLGYSLVSKTLWYEPECQYIGTNYDEPDRAGNISIVMLRDDNRHFIDHYNPELFLAIAGMTEGDKTVKRGEYLYVLKPYCEYKKGDITPWEYSDGHYNCEIMRKATLSELITHFTKKDMIYTLEDLREGKVACVNDGTKKQLSEVLAHTFTSAEQTGSGIFEFYMKLSDRYPSYWGASNKTDLPIQSVKLFHSQLPNNMNHNQSQKLFNYIADLTGHNCLVTEMQEIENIVLSEPKEHEFKFGDKVLYTEILGQDDPAIEGYFVAYAGGVLPFIVIDTIEQFEMFRDTGQDTYLTAAEICIPFPEPLKITRSEIAEWKGTDHFEIVD